MRDLIICTALVGLGLLIQRGQFPVVEPTCYIGLLAALAYFAGKLCQRLGLPVETGYVGVGVAARGFGVLPFALLPMAHPLIAMAFGWVGFGLGLEVGRNRRRWKVAHAPTAALSVLLPCLFATLALKALAGIPTPVALTLGVAASLSDPLLKFVAPDHIPETTLLTVFCGAASLLLYTLLSLKTGTLLLLISGIAGGGVVAVFWSETLVRVEPGLKEDTTLVTLLLCMVLLLQWASALLGYSLLLTALIVGLWTALRSDACHRLQRVVDAIGKGMGALLLSAFGMQIAIERLTELPKEVWGIAAIYLGAMVGGKLLSGALTGKKVHPYGRFTGIALLAQGPLLLEIDAQVRRKAALFGGAVDTIHAVLTVAALVGSLAVPILDHLLRRVTMTTRSGQELIV